MGKGGRYLKRDRKKGRGWKIALSVVLVLVLILGALGFAAVRYYNSMLDKIPRAEYENKDISDDELQSILDFNPDKPSDATQGSSETSSETTAEATE